MGWFDWFSSDDGDNNAESEELKKHAAAQTEHAARLNMLAKRIEVQTQIEEQNVAADASRDRIIAATLKEARGL